MVFRKIEGSLESRVIKWFDYLWANKAALDEETIFNMLPKKLKLEMAMHVHLNTLQKVRIFQDCEQGLLGELVMKLKLQVQTNVKCKRHIFGIISLKVYSPGDYVCKKGDVGREMYIIKRGKIDVVNEDGTKVFVTLGEGVVFGELSIMNIPGSKMGNRRTANVRAKGYADLFTLSKDDLWEALEEYPEAKNILLEKGKQILMKDNMIDEEKAASDAADRELLEQSVGAVNEKLVTLTEGMASFIAEFTSFQIKTNKRIVSLQAKKGLIEEVPK